MGIERHIWPSARYETNEPPFEIGDHLNKARELVQEARETLQHKQAAYDQAKIKQELDVLIRARSELSQAEFLLQKEEERLQALALEAEEQERRLH